MRSRDGKRLVPKPGGAVETEASMPHAFGESARRDVCVFRDAFLSERYN